MLSLLGLYNYDKGLFDNLKLPESVDKQTFISNLLAEAAEFEVLYPDADFMKKLIGEWSNKQYGVWQKLEETLSYDYNPISNFDRNEEWEESGDALGKVAGYNSQEMVNSSGTNTSGKRKGRVWGNIGVTTTQQMIDEQRRIVQFNLTDHIIGDFKNRFCILIY